MPLRRVASDRAILPAAGGAVQSRIGAVFRRGRYGNRAFRGRAYTPPARGGGALEVPRARSRAAQYEEWLRRGEALFESLLSRVERDLPEGDADAVKLLLGAFALFKRTLEIRRDLAEGKNDGKKTRRLRGIRLAPEEARRLEEECRRMDHLWPDEEEGA